MSLSLKLQKFINSWDMRIFFFTVSLLHKLHTSWSVNVYAVWAIKKLWKRKYAYARIYSSELMKFLLPCAPRISECSSVFANIKFTKMAPHVSTKGPKLRSKPFFLPIKKTKTYKMCYTPSCAGTLFYCINY